MVGLLLRDYSWTQICFFPVLAWAKGKTSWSVSWRQEPLAGLLAKTLCSLPPLHMASRMPRLFCRLSSLRGLCKRVAEMTVYSDLSLRGTPSCFPQCSGLAGAPSLAPVIQLVDLLSCTLGTHSACIAKAWMEPCGTLLTPAAHELFIFFVVL